MVEAHSGCLTDGDMRALVDRAASGQRLAAWNEHLRGCERCRTRLNLIDENAGAVAAMLDTVTPPLDAINENVALRKVHARQETREPNFPLLKGERLMSRISGVGRRGAIAGVAAVALMVAVIAAVPLSSFAQDMLTQFRVQQFSAITIPMDMFQGSSQLFGSAGSTGTQSADSSNSAVQAFVMAQLSDLGKLNSTLSKNSLKTASSIADAQTHLNGNMKVPSNLSTFSGVQPKVYLTDAGSISYAMNVQKARDILSLGKIDTAPLPDPTTTPTVTISLDVPAGAALDYVSNGKHLIVAQMVSPTLSIPSSVDMSMLRDELLASGVLPPNTVAQLRSIKDWQHTLIVPVPSGATTSNVTVQGNAGLLIKSNQGTVVMWQQNGVLHIIGSDDSNTNVMNVANSLK